MSTATEDRPSTDAPPTVLGTYLARLRHSETRNGTIIATIAAVAMAGGAIWWTGRRYRVGFADGHREGRMLQEFGDGE